MNFLIEYHKGKLLSFRKFDELKDGEDARLELELKVMAKHEVVLLIAENEEALRKTHGRYFYSLEDLMKLIQKKMGGH